MNPRLLTVSQAAELVSFSKSWVWAATREGRFPQPVKVGSATRWVREDVEAWVAGLRRSASV